MNTKTLKALKSSIAHWSRLARGKAKENEGLSTEDCALCGLFFYRDCVGCPIMGRTGFDTCRKTPYENAYADWRDYGKSSPQFKSAAKVQLAFLKSILPKKNT